MKTKVRSIEGCPITSIERYIKQMGYDGGDSIYETAVMLKLARDTDRASYP
jgi:hypothetical protein